jgi:hypothetical protein
MANYLIVVPRGNTELFDLLSAAFRGHTGFNVVIDRRGSESLVADAERRTSRVTPGPDEIVIAERSDRADRPLAGGESRSYPHVPVRRRRVRSGSAPRHRVVPGMSISRGATAC